MKTIGIVNDFLYTAVILDDHAELHSGSTTKQIIKVVEPIAGKIYPQEIDQQSGVSNLQNAAQELLFDAKLAIDSFASKGIVCSVIKPINSNEAWDKVKKVITKADILIFDWEIFDDGETVINVINQIVKTDFAEGPHLRLILIYTIDSNLDVISDKIRNILSKYGNNIHVDENGMALTLNFLRISIFGKEGARVKPEYLNRVLTVEALVDQSSLEFAKISSGIVSNVALQSISVIRRNVPSILGKFGSDIDPAFLSHRLFLDYPDDANDLTVDMIASELHSILQNYKVGDMANIESIDAWINFGNRKSIICNESSGNRLSYDQMLACLKSGLKWVEVPSTVIRKGKKPDKTVTRIFCDDPTNSELIDRIDCKFAILTSLKYDFNNPIAYPSITLGTILKSYDIPAPDLAEYWLCIQPKCDTVRIKDKRKFFFLPLYKQGEDQDGKPVDIQNFDLVVKETKYIKHYYHIGNYCYTELEDEYIKLSLKYNIYRGSHFEFSTNGSNDGTILAVKEDDSYIFQTTNGMRFKWVSELKSDQAQKIANDFAANISRVGTDISEYLRRWSN